LPTVPYVKPVKDVVPSAIVENVEFTGTGLTSTNAKVLALIHNTSLYSMMGRCSFKVLDTTDGLIFASYPPSPFELLSGQATMHFSTLVNGETSVVRTPIYPTVKDGIFCFDFTNVSSAVLVKDDTFEVDFNVNILGLFKP
jgi:hypothetical protein